LSKPALRYLALGFLVSAIILAGYRSFLYQPQVVDSSESDTAPLTQDELTYKEKYETLLAETELAQLETAMLMKVRVQKTQNLLHQMKLLKKAARVILRRAKKTAKTLRLPPWSLIKEILVVLRLVSCKNKVLLKILQNSMNF